MLSHFPKTTSQIRIDKLLYFLKRHCSGIASEINTNIDMVREKWEYTVNNLTDEQLRIGCEYCLKYDEPFISPQRFRFKAHGLPDTKIAYQQAIDKVYTHSAVRDAAIRANINSAYGSDKEKYNNFAASYVYICGKILEGMNTHTEPEKVAVSQPDLAKLRKKARISEVSKAEMGKMRKILGIVNKEDLCQV